MNRRFIKVQSFAKKYWNLISVAVISFYLGSWSTLSLMSIDSSIESYSTKRAITVSAHEFNEEVEYAAFVLSAPTNWGKRDAIRSTWGRLVNNVVIHNEKKVFTWNQKYVPMNRTAFIKIYFVIGTKNLNPDILIKIAAEHRKNSDIVFLESVEDKYENLAFKVLTGIKHFYERFENLKYVIKCDDDSFVRIDLLVVELEIHAPHMKALSLNKYVTFKNRNSYYDGFYWGYFNGKARVFSQGKWKEKDWFLCDKYLPYALGGGYVISHSIVGFIASNYKYLSVYNSEDVSMGVWTAALKNINRVHDIRFDTEWTTRGCQDHMLVRQKQTPSDMFQMYETLVSSDGKIMCLTEDIKRNTYFYNWNVSPSNCCTIIH